MEKSPNEIKRMSVKWGAYLLLKFLSSMKSTVWKNEKFTLTGKIFRETNTLVKSLLKTLLSRKFCQKNVRVNLHNFHTVYQVWKEGKNLLPFFSFAKRKSNMIYWRKTFLIKRAYFSNEAGLQFFFSVAKPVKSHVDKLRLFLFNPRKTPFT